MDYDEILQRLKSMSDPRAVEGMVRFRINPKNTLGVSIPNLRKIAKEAGTDHVLAQRLWESGLHEVRILASMVDDPEMVTEQQMEKWVKGFDSWDVCDQCCGNLFDKTRFAYQKAAQWSKRMEEFVKRAGFALIAALAVHDRRGDDKEFLRFLPLIKLGATDERNFVKKAVNWALRQVGKRNRKLNKAAIKTAKEIQQIESRAAKWIASDALRELESGNVTKKLSQR